MSLSIGQIDDDWCQSHFDFAAPELGDSLYEVLAHMRSRCPVAHTDAHGEQWVLTRYRDVIQVAQDWRRCCGDREAWFICMSRMPSA